jgi:hypothetical protein
MYEGSDTMPRVMSQHSDRSYSSAWAASGAPDAPGSRNLRRRRPGNRHAELLILCARIGFNP